MAVPIIGLGAGGHAKVLLEILRQNSEYDFVGLLDPRQQLWNHDIAGVKVLGGDNLISKLRASGVDHAFIGLGGVGDNSQRASIYNLMVEYGFKIVMSMHSRAIVSNSARIGNGVMIMAGAIINADAVIGNNVIINTGSIVEHDCVVGDHVHIASGACLAGGVWVGQNAHVGLGASVRQGVQIGQSSIIGAGAVVIKNVEPNTVVAGVPATILERN